MPRKQHDNDIILGFVSDQGFIYSDLINVYPCAYRGRLATSSQEIIDPESRLNTEYNYTHSSALIGKDSYIVDAHKTNDTKVSFFIKNYLFTIDLSKNFPAFGGDGVSAINALLGLDSSAKKYWAFVTLETKGLIGSAQTKILRDKAITIPDQSTTCVDRVDPRDAQEAADDRGSIFTGLKIVDEASATTDELAIITQFKAGNKEIITSLGSKTAIEGCLPLNQNTTGYGKKYVRHNITLEDVDLSGENLEGADGDAKLNVVQAKKIIVKNSEEATNAVTIEDGKIKVDNAETEAVLVKSTTTSEITTYNNQIKIGYNCDNELDGVIDVSGMSGLVHASRWVSGNMGVSGTQGTFRTLKIFDIHEKPIANNGRFNNTSNCAEIIYNMSKDRLEHVKNGKESSLDQKSILVELPAKSFGYYKFMNDVVNASPDKLLIDTVPRIGTTSSGSKGYKVRFKTVNLADVSKKYKTFSTFTGSISYKCIMLPLFASYFGCPRAQMFNYTTNTSIGGYKCKYTRLANYDITTQSVICKTLMDHYQYGTSIDITKFVISQQDISTVETPVSTLVSYGEIENRNCSTAAAELYNDIELFHNYEGVTNQDIAVRAMTATHTKYKLKDATGVEWNANNYSDVFISNPSDGGSAVNWDSATVVSVNDIIEDNTLISKLRTNVDIAIESIGNNLELTSYDDDEYSLKLEAGKHLDSGGTYMQLPKVAIHLLAIQKNKSQTIDYRSYYRGTSLGKSVYYYGDSMYVHTSTNVNRFILEYVNADGIDFTKPREIVVHCEVFGLLFGGVDGYCGNRLPISGLPLVHDCIDVVVWSSN